jgi:hypothetical protein
VGRHRAAGDRGERVDQRLAAVRGLRLAFVEGLVGREGDRQVVALEGDRAGAVEGRGERGGLLGELVEDGRPDAFDLVEVLGVDRGGA